VNPDPITGFEYLVRLGHNRQNISPSPNWMVWERNFEEIPDLVAAFEYLIKLGCKRQNAAKC
jgi:hypothetical protein